MLSALFDLSSLAASSPPALKAEQERLSANLKTLRTSLALVAAVPTGPEAKASKGQFSNAASDLFCYARLTASATNAVCAGLPSLAVQVEEVLLLLGSNRLQSKMASCLLEALDAELQKLSEISGLPRAGTPPQSAA